MKFPDFTITGILNADLREITNPGNETIIDLQDRGDHVVIKDPDIRSCFPIDCEIKPGFRREFYVADLVKQWLGELPAGIHTTFNNSFNLDRSDVKLMADLTKNGRLPFIFLQQATTTAPYLLEHMKKVSVVYTVQDITQKKDSDLGNRAYLIHESHSQHGLNVDAKTHPDLLGSFGARLTTFQKASKTDSGFIFGNTKSFFIPRIVDEEEVFRMISEEISIRFNELVLRYIDNISVAYLDH